MGLKSLIHLFNPPPDIHDLAFSHLRWDEQIINDHILSWTSPDYPAHLSLRYFKKKPDLPAPPGNINRIRSFFREKIAHEYGGILKVDIVPIERTSCIEVLYKIPVQPSGIKYISSITLPFKQCYFVIQLQIEERVMADIREVVIARKLISEKTVTIADQQIVGWSADPYLSGYDQGILMNMAEREEYDALFPDHPLTMVRRLMKKIHGSIQFSQRLKRQPSYLGTDSH